MNLDLGTRIGKTIRNVSWSIFAQSITYFLSFIYRTIFINFLGIEYLGAQGLFGNILNLLSFAELGVGNAIVFSLYKPLAEKDNSKVKVLLQIYKKLYFIIGSFIGIVGILITPFLGYFIKGEVGFPNKELIFILFVMDASSSYFFAYKKSLYSADQKEYKNSIIISTFTMISTIIQIFVVIFTRSFIISLIVKVIFSLIMNMFISIKVSAEYSDIFSAELTTKIEQSNKIELFNKIRALMYHKIGSLIVNSTDNLLISSFIGLSSVGLYSNYLLLIGLVKATISQFTQAVSASVGNLTVTETKEYTWKTFKLLELINYWAYYFTSICIFILINPFIDLWIGEDYLFDPLVVVVLVLMYYITGMRQNILTFRNALGLFWNDRYKPLIEAIINLVVSIILLKYMGIVGVFIGTIISTATTSLWIEPYILYKHYFNLRLKEYLINYILRIFIVGISCSIIGIIKNNIYQENWISFFGLTITCIVISNIIFILFHVRNIEFKRGVSIIKAFFV